MRRALPLQLSTYISQFAGEVRFCLAELHQSTTYLMTRLPGNASSSQGGSRRPKALLDSNNFKKHIGIDRANTTWRPTAEEEANQARGMKQKIWRIITKNGNGVTKII